jgi:hypothetical protein
MSKYFELHTQLRGPRLRQRESISHIRTELNRLHGGIAKWQVTESNFFATEHYS